MAFVEFQKTGSDLFSQKDINLQQSVINHLQNLKYHMVFLKAQYLGHFYFWYIYINDLNKAIIHNQVHHFADDTNFLITGKSLKKINKYVNHDLRLLCHWLRANKISLNASKTESIIFKRKNKQIQKHLNFRVSGQKIEITNSVKYLGIQLNDS